MPLPRVSKVDEYGIQHRTLSAAGDALADVHVSVANYRITACYHSICGI
jgi:hypothetical protein